MMRFDPFREIEELQQRVDKMFSNNSSGQGRGFYAPTVDVHEDERGLEISLDLPGVRPEDIKLEAENNTVTVQAERKYQAQQGRTAHRTERVYGTFVRTFNIPSRYDLAKIEATHEHGSLTLHVPRAEQAMRRAIPIKAGTTNALTEQGGQTTIDAEQTTPSATTEQQTQL